MVIGHNNMIFAKLKIFLNNKLYMQHLSETKKLIFEGKDL